MVHLPPSVGLSRFLCNAHLLPRKGRGVTDLVFKLFGNFPGEGLTAKVAIGCGALIDGLLQVQLSGIIQETK